MNKRMTRLRPQTTPTYCQVKNGLTVVSFCIIPVVLEILVLGYTVRHESVGRTLENEQISERYHLLSITVP